MYFEVLVPRLCAVLLNPCKFVQTRPNDNSAEPRRTPLVSVTLTWRMSTYQKFQVAHVYHLNRARNDNNIVIIIFLLVFSTYIKKQGCEVEGIKCFISKILRWNKSNLFSKPIVFDDRSSTLRIVYCADAFSDNLGPYSQSCLHVRYRKGNLWLGDNLAITSHFSRNWLCPITSIYNLPLQLMFYLRTALWISPLPSFVFLKLASGGLC